MRCARRRANRMSTANAAVDASWRMEEKEDGTRIYLFPAAASAAAGKLAAAAHQEEEEEVVVVEETLEGEGERERRDIAGTLNLRTAILLVVRRRWPKVLLAAAAMTGATAVILASPLFSSGVIECLIGAKPAADFTRLLCGLVVIYTIEPIFTFLYVRNVCSLGEEIVESLRRDLFRALLVQRVR